MICYKHAWVFYEQDVASSDISDQSLDNKKYKICNFLTFLLNKEGN